MAKEPGKDQKVMSTAGRVLLAGVLMFGLVLAAVYIYRLAAGRSNTTVLDFLFIIIGTAVGGAIGIRITGLGWRQTTLAVLLSVVGLIVYARFVPTFPGPWVGSGNELDPTTTLSYLVIGTAGVFFLPLFDPAVRRAGPAPSLQYLALVAITLTVLALVADYLIGRGASFGLVTLILGSIAAGLLLGLGMILALANLTAVGAWLGGLGLVLEACIGAAWWLLGTPWFP